ncbi:MAG: hypothetical protein EBY41_07275 [Proteobacteria bacterium]|nr:hypothetical protein [Pseudomonadota bacterium]
MIFFRKAFKRFIGLPAKWQSLIIVGFAMILIALSLRFIVQPLWSEHQLAQQRYIMSQTQLREMIALLDSYRADTSSLMQTEDIRDFTLSSINDYAFRVISFQQPEGNRIDLTLHSNAENLLMNWVSDAVFDRELIIESMQMIQRNDNTVELNIQLSE